MFRHHSFQKFQLSGRIILLLQHSSSLTVVFLTKQKESRFPAGATPTTCALARLVLSCPVAVCGYVHERALGTPFRYLAMRFTFISSLSVGASNLSRCFLHAVHDVSTFLAHVQQISHGCPVHGSFLVLQFEPVILSLVSSSHLESTRVSSFPGQAQRSRFASTEYPRSRSLNHSAEKEDFVTQFLHSSHDPHHDLI